jgi:hypothetical protein
MTLVLSLVLTSLLVAAAEQTPAAPPAAPAGSAAAAVPDAAGQGRSSGGRGGGRGGAPRVAHIPDAPVLPYVPIDNPLPLPGGEPYGVVAAVALNSKGHVFVLHRVAAPLAEFDEHGQFVRSWPVGPGVKWHSVRIDSADNIWLVDTGDEIVTKLSPTGEVLLTLGTHGTAGTGAEDAARPLFNAPSDVGIAENGDIFVSQGESGGPDPRVIHFDKTGKFVNTWSLALAEGSRSNPHAIAIDRDGLVYVADRMVMRIRIFRPDGAPVRELPLPTEACGIFIDRDQTIWIATGFDGQMMKVDMSGKVLGYAGKAGSGLGAAGEAHMITVAPNGDVYLADTNGRKIEKFAKQ